MVRNFYFRNEAYIVMGAVAFAAKISASPETYGISAERAEAFGVLSATLQSAYAVTTAPATRTRPAVQGKNDALKAMRAEAINLTRTIAANPAVSDAQLIELGLLPRATRTARQVPSEPPSLSISGMSLGLINLSVKPSNSSRRGKPFGAAGANLYSFIGDNPPSDPRNYHFEKMTTRAKAQLQFPGSVASGATVWLTARWVSARGQTSPLCAPVSAIIQGGGALPTISLAA